MGYTTVLPARLPKRLAREEAAALINQPSRRYPTGIRDRAMLRLMYRAGLRCGETLALSPTDVVPDRREVRINKGKAGHDRVVWVDDATIEILDRWIAIRPVSDFLFCTLKGRQLRDRDVREMVARRSRKAGIDHARVHPHMLRHTFASEALEDGVTLAELQQLLGHRDLATTAIYLHVANDRLREILVNRSG